MAFKHFVHAFCTAALVLLAQPTAASADTFRIVGFGDSLMAGYQLGPDEAFPQRLEAALKARGHDVSVANAGVSGDTSSGGLSRLDWSVPDGTDLVILELGANDMLRGLPPEITRKNLDAMIASLKARGIDVLLAGMLAAPNLGAEFASQFNSIFPDLAAKHGVALYPFFLDGVAADRAYLLEDGMHPNARGVQRMAERALPVIEAAMKARRAAQ
ncbi:MAG: arylesterase [Mesorhizobium sp.]|nr:arylesterase [Mesorhizobium sp.]